MSHTIDYENLKKLNEPFFEAYSESFRDTLQSGWFILGKKVEEFETAFARYCGGSHCIGMASGLDALVLSLKALELPEGSEIIVPSNTYIATILAVLLCHHKPVLVEPDLQTYNIDPALIEAAIGPDTRAIMVVHLYGKLCAMEAIRKIAITKGLYLIEDCAQAHGAAYKGEKAGTFGDFGAFSFYPTKNLGALGDAGAVVTNSEVYAKSLRKLRNYGSEVKYHNEVAGYNSRLDEVQAGFLSIKLKALDSINEHKRHLASIYQQHVKEDFIKPLVQQDYFDVYHIYTIRHPQRDKLREYLLENGIKTEIHYPVAPHKQKAMEGHFKGEAYPISEEIHRTTLSLPISYFHREEDIYRVTEVLNKF
jgi:dTDP-4-amino-4,6-dideoxygalactose transaminase